MNVVEVRNAYKFYGHKKNDHRTVLNQLNMTISPGSIYGLMGASGCGKTTLLSCIIGMIPLDSGKINVFGNEITHFSLQKNGKRIGYMPQEMALIGDLTVKETIYYFGKIFQMDTDKIRERYEMLHNLLELPPGDQLIRECSGGQQRRVSFASSMIHDPELLILDEPTVGLDPILREKIWKFMINVTRTSNLTIIITTHYIEEAKQADRIGLMRNGVLLAEDSPLNVMNSLNVDNLEEAFLRLCLRKGVSDEVEENTEGIIIGANKINNNGLEMQPKNTINCNNLKHDKLDNHRKKDDEEDSNMRFRWQIIYALIVKNVLQIKRQPASVIYLMLMPVIQLYFLRYSIGGNPKDLKIGIVDDEILNHQECKVPGLINAYKEDYVCEVNLISCRFLEKLTDDVGEKVFYTAFDDAFRDAKLGKLSAIIYFDANFTESYNEVKRYPNEADPQTWKNSVIKVYMDRSDLQISTYLERRIYDVYKDYSESILTDCQLPKNLESIPIVFEKPIFGSLQSDFQHSMVPAFVILSLFNVTASLTVSAFVSERKEGFWNRTLLAGVSTVEMMASHITINIVVQILQIVEMLIIVYFYYDPHHYGSYLLVVSLLLLVGVSGLFFGVYISCICTEIMQSHILLLGLTQPITVLSGMFWPVEGMPSVIKAISLITPTTLPGISLLNIIQKGYTLADRSVFMGFIVASGWVVFSCYFGLRILKNKKYSRNT
ncbi:ABC transporter G family member 20-like [Chironomus tepperi]|uniref:ABC transporter G family member 20-like n=1 Tax=Chironomus tepperi TaxID=113505 RepID=UPI00391F1AF0